MPRPRNRKSVERKNLRANSSMRPCSDSTFSILDGDVQQVFDQRAGALRLEGLTRLRQIQAQQKQRRELRSKGLGGSHADFRTRVRDSIASIFISLLKKSISSLILLMGAPPHL